MGRYTIKRLLSLIPILFIVSIVAFSLVRIMPGGAAEAYLSASGIPPTDEAIKTATRELGLNKPLITQYVDWLRDILHFDFGVSYVSKKNVSEELIGHLSYTIKLALTSLVWIFLISMPLGIYSSLNPNGKIDHFSRIISFVGSSTPPFLLGFILVKIFSLELKILPVSGAETSKHIILPSITLACAYIATYSRLLRNSLLENINKRYVTYARARGVKGHKIISYHVLKNSLIPVVTSLGLNFGSMLAGTVIVESIFSWPGLGRLIISSVSNRDYPMIQGYIIMMAVIFILANLIADLACAALNPKIRLKEQTS